jgi:uncharacterized repeat protein (TIGR02543 family)
MKKAIFSILTVLTVLALVMTGCPSPGGKPSGEDGDTFTVKFNKNSGSDAVTGLPEEQTVEKGGKATAPDSDPERAGYTFVGWYKESSGKTAWDFDEDTVTKNITLYAKWTKGDDPGGTVPVINQHPQGFSKPVNTTDDISLGVSVSNVSTIGATKLKLQWYKDASETGNGTAFGNAVTGYNQGRNTTPTKEVGTAYYWVVVTNTDTSETATSNKARVTFGEAVTDTAIEKIAVANAAMPLWEFTLPDGASWADYETFSIQYYVSKTSNAYTAASIRTRLYGAYVAGDFETPDQGNDNGWGTGSGVPNGYRMINWNAGTFREQPNGGSAPATINNNNDFIIDNTGGSAASFGSIFSSASGAPSQWFTKTYATNEGIAKDFAKVTMLNKEEVDVIYVGAGIFGPGGDQSVLYEFYTRNPTLINKSDTTKNIIGKPTMTGTSEQLFAGNLGSARNGTVRSVLASGDDYEDVEGQIRITIDLDGGTGNSNIPAFFDIMEGQKLPATFFTTPPTRDGFDFLGWFDGDTQVTAMTTFDEATTVTAKWLRLSVLLTYRVDLNGQTYKNTEAWTTANNNGFAIKLGDEFDATLYEKIVVVAKFYGSDGTTELDTVTNGAFALKWYPIEVSQGNASGNKGSSWNFGTGGTYDATAKTITWTADIPAAAKTDPATYIGFHTTAADNVEQFIEIVGIKFTYTP